MSSSLSSSPSSSSSSPSFSASFPSSSSSPVSKCIAHGCVRLSLELGDYCRYHTQHPPLDDIFADPRDVKSKVDSSSNNPNGINNYGKNRRSRKSTSDANQHNFHLSDVSTMQNAVQIHNNVDDDPNSTTDTNNTNNKNTNQNQKNYVNNNNYNHQEDTNYSKKELTTYSASSQIIVKSHDPSSTPTLPPPSAAVVGLSSLPLPIHLPINTADLIPYEITADHEDGRPLLPPQMTFLYDDLDSGREKDPIQKLNKEESKQSTPRFHPAVSPTSLSSSNPGLVHHSRRSSSSSSSSSSFPSPFIQPLSPNHLSPRSPQNLSRLVNSLVEKLSSIEISTRQSSEREKQLEEKIKNLTERITNLERKIEGGEKNKQIIQIGNTTPLSSISSPFNSQPNIEIATNLSAISLSSSPSSILPSPTVPPTIRNYPLAPLFSPSHKQSNSTVELNPFLSQTIYHSNSNNDINNGNNISDDYSIATATATTNTNTTSDNNNVNNFNNVISNNPIDSSPPSNQFTLHFPVSTFSSLTSPTHNPNSTINSIPNSSSPSPSSSPYNSRPPSSPSAVTAAAATFSAGAQISPISISAQAKPYYPQPHPHTQPIRLTNANGNSTRNKPSPICIAPLHQSQQAHRQAAQQLLHPLPSPISTLIHRSNSSNNNSCEEPSRRRRSRSGIVSE